MTARIFALLVAYILPCAVVGCGSISRPSEAEVRQCVLASRSGRDSISQVDFGNTIISQGGMIELAMGAPKDTKIFPVNVHFPQGAYTTMMTFWAFKDSFGQLKCERGPGGETRTYQTAEQAAQEAERQRLAAEQQAAQQRMQEQERAMIAAKAAEDQRLADERAVVERRAGAARLRDSLRPGAVLNGAQQLGTKDLRLRLKVISFDPSTGSFFGEDAWLNQKTSAFGPPNRVVGSVSENMLYFTEAVFNDESGTLKHEYTLRFTLRLEGDSRRLVGDWKNENNQGDKAWFDLK